MNTFFIHINNHTGLPKGTNLKKCKPSYTIAGIIENGKMRIGISQCSPRDQFVKRIGRVRAEGRAHSHASINIDIPDEVLKSNELGKFFVNQSKKLI